MTYTREDFVGKTEQEIRDIAEKLNIKAHHKAKPETIVNQILQQGQAYVADAMKHPAERSNPVISYVNTPDDVRNAIKHIASKDGFECRFLDDNTWHFRCKGAEDSGNLSIPLRVIVTKAEMVSRGKRSLLGFKDGTDIVMWG